MFFCGSRGWKTTTRAFAFPPLPSKHKPPPGASTLEVTVADRGAAGKLRIYHTIYRLNLSFANIVEHCAALQEYRVFTATFTRIYQSYAQELQAEINQDVLETLDGIESHDMFRFGKVRSAREKELRDPDDVFIHAEERRQELARQSKKHRARSRKDAIGRSRVKRPALKGKTAGEKIR
jgi:hypothetical protein